MVIAFTLKRCHDYLADITHRTRYSRTIQYVRRVELRNTISTMKYSGFYSNYNFLFIQRYKKLDYRRFF